MRISGGILLIVSIGVGVVVSVAAMLLGASVLQAAFIGTFSFASVSMVVAAFVLSDMMRP